MRALPRALRLAPIAALTALLATALLATAPLGAQSRIRIVQRDSTKPDSAMLQLTIDMGEIMRMTSELMTSKAMEERIAMALRNENNPERERALESKLEEIAMRRAGLMTRLQLQCSQTNAVPDGYLGVTFEMPSREVSSVEPGSPAEKAGLRRGDAVLTIGGYDAQNAPLVTLLKPGATIALKVRREGTAREVTAVVGRRPDGFGTTACTGIDGLIAPERTPPVATFLRWRRPNVVPPPAPPAPPNFVYSFSTTPGMGAVAGASLTPVDADWRETLGVERGLVVIAVASGSPAAGSGLRKGDVIVQADDAQVQTVSALRRVLNDSDSRSVKLQVVRRGKLQTLTLSWR